MSGGDDQLGFLFQAAARRVWTIADLLSAARTALEREYVDIWVEGEISNYRPAESGHLYFTLKDGSSQLRVVMFRSQARLLRFKPANGMQIIARGRLTIYEARGELQLSAEMLEPKGAGALQLAFEQLKAKLAAEGLFDPARKKPMPFMPRRIGIITSPRGAAIRDILNILRRRHESVHLLIFPAQVQGAAAPLEVAAGLRHFNRAGDVEVIIIARGGGSAEDLAAFNDEDLARAVAASNIPVISAVGHETDFTITDFVADLRAPTPSAAAELVIESKQRIDERVRSLHDRLSRAVRYRLVLLKGRLTELAQHASMVRISDHLNRRQQRLDELSYRMAATATGRLQRFRRRLENAQAGLRAHDLRRVLSASNRQLQSNQLRLDSGIRHLLAARNARLQRIQASLDALSPLRILDRGYALVFDVNGDLVKDAAQLSPGDELTARFARGSVAATVKQRRTDS